MKFENLITELENNLTRNNKTVVLCETTNEDLNEILGKILQDVHCGRLPNDYIFEALYHILEHFNFNFDLLECKSKDEQTDILYSLLDDFEAPMSYARLLDWVAQSDFSFYVDEILRSQLQFLPVDSLEALLQMAYNNFVQEIGSNLITALLEYSE